MNRTQEDANVLIERVAREAPELRFLETYHHQFKYNGKPQELFTVVFRASNGNDLLFRSHEDFNSYQSSKAPTLACTCSTDQTLPASSRLSLLCPVHGDQRDTNIDQPEFSNLDERHLIGQRFYEDLWQARVSLESVINGLAQDEDPGEGIDGLKLLTDALAFLRTLEGN